MRAQQPMLFLPPIQENLRLHPTAIPQVKQVAVTPSPLLEKIIKGDDALKHSAIIVLGHATGGNQCEMNSLAGRGFLNESIKPVPHNFAVIAVNCKCLASVLDFTEIYYVVLPVNDQVYLRALPVISLVYPCIAIAGDTRNAQSHLYLHDMLKTKALKCKARPGRMQGGVQRRRPEMRVTRAVVRDKLVVKQRKIVRQLVKLLT